ncbi:MAG: exodeoxyribonuclease-3 [Alphaproteobacteria bacterium]|jgi:exodeoxyribonuclease-3
MVKIVSWNVNSVRARLQNVIDFIQTYQPDILGLQEIKCVNEQFPLDVFEDLGYNCHIFGQKSYNGVALLSKIPMTDIQCGLPDFDLNSDNLQSRYIAGHINLTPNNMSASKGIEIINCYMPNGNPVDTPKHAYKLAWTRHLVDLIRQKIDNQEAFILMGDFNIIPTDFDVHDPDGWQGDALFRDDVKGLYRELNFMGLTDAIRHFHPSDPCFTFWDYQGRAREQDKGIRIDHFLVTPDISEMMTSASVIDTVRDAPKASDHAPIILEIF